MISMGSFLFQVMSPPEGSLHAGFGIEIFQDGEIGAEGSETLVHVNMSVESAPGRPHDYASAMLTVDECEALSALLRQAAILARANGGASC